MVKKLKRVTVKEEFVSLTGDAIKAILLNQFVYWSERVADFDSFISEEKSRAEQNGLTVTMELTNGWIYKTAEELAKETMLGVAPNTILRHLKYLVEKGWLDERHNPNHKWDRTKQYRVNLLRIYSDLMGIGYTLQDYKVDVPFSILENGISKTENGISEMENRTLQNGKAIPEITTEITTVVVVDPPAGPPANCTQTAPACPIETPGKPAWEEIREEVRAVAGDDISVSFAKEIAESYPPAKIDSAFSELRRQLAQGVEIRGVGAWLRYALANDIQPDRVAKTKTIPERIPGRRRAANNRTPRARSKGLPETSYPGTPEQEQKRRELLASMGGW